MNSSSDQQPQQLETVTSQSSNYLSSRYFDNPLTAVTSAMLHISGNSQPQNDDDTNNNNNVSNNINLNALQSNITHQIHQVHNGNGTTSYEYYKIADKDGLQWTR